jgi:hypothetical protein
MAWDRLHGESAKAYHAFCIYRDLGPKRSLSRVRDVIYPNANGKTGRLQEWSKEYSWVKRSEAWDEWNDRATQEAFRDEVAATAKRHAQQARSFTVGLSAVNAELLRRLQTDPMALSVVPIDDLVKLSVRSGTQMAKLQQAERAALVGGTGALPDKLAETGDEGIPSLVIEVVDDGSTEGDEGTPKPAAKPDFPQQGPL